MVLHIKISEREFIIYLFYNVAVYKLYKEPMTKIHECWGGDMPKSKKKQSVNLHIRWLSDDRKQTDKKKKKKKVPTKYSHVYMAGTHPRLHSYLTHFLMRE